MRFVVVTGLAGAGKTSALRCLAARGEQVVDLEELAAHRGSSFGRIGIDVPPPTQAEFDDRVHAALAACDPTRVVWLEDEGPHIGPLWLPPAVRQAIATADVVALTPTFDERAERLVATYGTADPGDLIAATQRIRRRLGHARTDRAISHFHAGHPDRAIRVLLGWFDEGYLRRSAGDTRRRLSVPALTWPAPAPRAAATPTPDRHAGWALR